MSACACLSLFTSPPPLPLAHTRAQDLPEASRAIAKAEGALKELAGLDDLDAPEYRDFYLRKLRALVNQQLDASCGRSS